MAAEATHTYRTRSRWLALGVLGVGVPLLVVAPVVADAPIRTPWHLATVAIGATAIAAMGIGAWKTTVTVTADEVVTSGLAFTRRYPRADVRGLVQVGAGDFDSVVLIMDHDRPFPRGHPHIPVLAGSGLPDLADVLGVPLLTEEGYRRFLVERQTADPDLAEFAADPPPPIRVRWILGWFLTGLCYVAGALALAGGISSTVNNGISAGAVAALAGGGGAIVLGEAFRRWLTPDR